MSFSSIIKVTGKIITENQHKYFYVIDVDQFQMIAEANVVIGIPSLLV